MIVSLCRVFYSSAFLVNRSPTQSFVGRLTATSSASNIVPQDNIIMSSPSSKNLGKRKERTSGNKQQQPWYYKFTQGDPIYTDYMSNEWSHEKQTDNELFEKLSLEGAQAGLSWRTILHKREAYRCAFHNFDIDKVANMTTTDIDDLMLVPKDTAKNDMPTVVRHRGKLESVINNAKMIQHLKENGTITTSFSSYLWSFVNHKPILNTWTCIEDIPSKTIESEAMSRELKKAGFKFVGPTTCYSLMQSCGFVIDHVKGCKEWIEAEKRLKKRKGGYQRR